MQIADIRTSVHRFETQLPLRKPARGSDRVYCEMETTDGRVGFGMSAKFMPHAIASAVTEHLKPAIVGMDIRDMEKIHERLEKVMTERGCMSGINLNALSCVDLALWDLNGQVRGETVARMLGGYRDEVGVYITYGFGTYATEELIQVGRDLVAKGHRNLKVLVGTAKEGWREDVRRVQAVREALGPDVGLSIDANESLPLDSAVRLARALEECDIDWFEDPLHNMDARDLARLRTMTSIPLSGGQMDGHSQRFRQWIEHGSLDIFMPNSLYNGGMTETCKVAHLAQIYNRPLSDAGGGGLYSVHHVAGFRNGTLAESHLQVEQVERQLFVDAPEPTNGVIAVPRGPGFGLTVNKDVLRDTLIKTG
ncbi:mandelate racemase/muconate lactonizing enzyme family protein [Fodinicurvata sp. EGI_FJ10296]|uniref:mandelate racemase/muconate lactonizing enzyme family protein n=1 Tax=Fodinicurvata sp. EGI_FJ10296 TaxID=3231908 RepID=UPI0034549212